MTNRDREEIGVVFITIYESLKKSLSIQTPLGFVLIPNTLGELEEHIIKFLKAEEPKNS